MLQSYRLSNYLRSISTLVFNILGRKLLYHGEIHEVNSSQNHRSCPGRATHNALNITKLTYDMAMLDRITMVYIFNDTEGYYDMMRHNLMTIATEQMICPTEAVLCHTRILNQIK